MAGRIKGTTVEIGGDTAAGKRAFLFSSVSYTLSGFSTSDLYREIVKEKGLPVSRQPLKKCALEKCCY